MLFFFFANSSINKFRSIEFKFDENVFHIHVKIKKLDTSFTQGKEKNLSKVHNKLLFLHVQRFFSFTKAYREIWGMEAKTSKRVILYSIFVRQHFWDMIFFWCSLTDLRIKWQDKRTQWMFRLVGTRTQTEHWVPWIKLRLWKEKTSRTKSE